MSWSCGICFEDGKSEAGEIDSCFHRYCFECIIQWSGSENTCPFCKIRFHVIRRKKLGDPQQPDPGPNAELEGEVLEVVEVQDKNQTITWADPIPAFLATLTCQVCGTEENEEQLLICDGCEAGYHTYCMHLPGVPDGDWFCPRCTEGRARRGGRQTAQAAGVTGNRRRRASPPPSGRPARRRRAALDLFEDDEEEEDWDFNVMDDDDEEDEVDEEDDVDFMGFDDEEEVHILSIDLRRTTSGARASTANGARRSRRGAGNGRASGRRATNNTSAAGSGGLRTLTRQPRTRRGQSAAATRAGRSQASGGTQPTTSSQPTPPAASNAAPPRPPRPAAAAVPPPVAPASRPSGSVVSGLRRPANQQARTAAGMRSALTAAQNGGAAGAPGESSGSYIPDALGLFTAIRGIFSSTPGSSQTRPTAATSSGARPAALQERDAEAWRRADILLAAAAGPSSTGGRTAAASAARQRAVERLRMQNASSSGRESSGSGQGGGQVSQHRRPSVSRLRTAEPVLALSFDTTAPGSPPTTRPPLSNPARTNVSSGNVNTISLQAQNASRGSGSGSGSGSGGNQPTTAAAAGSRGAPAPFLIAGTSRTVLEMAGRTRRVDPEDKEMLLRAVMRRNNPPSRLRQHPDGDQPSSSSLQHTRAGPSQRSRGEEERNVRERRVTSDTDAEGSRPAARQRRIGEEQTNVRERRVTSDTDEGDKRLTALQRSSSNPQPGLQRVERGQASGRGHGSGREPTVVQGSGRGNGPERESATVQPSARGNRTEREQARVQPGAQASTSQRTAPRNMSAEAHPAGSSAGAAQYAVSNSLAPAAKRARLNETLSETAPSVAPLALSCPSLSGHSLPGPSSAAAAQPVQNPRRLTGLSSSFISQDSRRKAQAECPPGLPVNEALPTQASQEALTGPVPGSQTVAAPAQMVQAAEEDMRSAEPVEPSAVPCTCPPSPGQRDVEEGAVPTKQTMLSLSDEMKVHQVGRGCDDGALRRAQVTEQENVHDTVHSTQAVTDAVHSTHAVTDAVHSTHAVTDAGQNARIVTDAVHSTHTMPDAVHNTHGVTDAMTGIQAHDGVCSDGGEDQQAAVRSPPSEDQCDGQQGATSSDDEQVQGTPSHVQQTTQRCKVGGEPDAVSSKAYHETSGGAAMPSKNLNEDGLLASAEGGGREGDGRSAAAAETNVATDRTAHRIDWHPEGEIDGVEAGEVCDEAHQSRGVQSNGTSSTRTECLSVQNEVAQQQDDEHYAHQMHSSTGVENEVSAPQLTKQVSGADCASLQTPCATGHPPGCTGNRTHSICVQAGVHADCSSPQHAGSPPHPHTQSPSHPQAPTAPCLNSEQPAHVQPWHPIGQALATLQSNPLPTLQSNALPRLESTPLPTFQSAPWPTFESTPLPTLESTPFQQSMLEREPRLLVGNAGAGPSRDRRQDPGGEAVQAQLPLRDSNLHHQNGHRSTHHPRLKHREHGHATKRHDEQDPHKHRGTSEKRKEREHGTGHERGHHDHRHSSSRHQSRSHHNAHAESQGRRHKVIHKDKLDPVTVQVTEHRPNIKAIASARLKEFLRPLHRQGAVGDEQYKTALMVGTRWLWDLHKSGKIEEENLNDDELIKTATNVGLQEGGVDVRV